MMAMTTTTTVLTSKSSSVERALRSLISTLRTAPVRLTLEARSILMTEKSSSGPTKTA